MKSEQFDFFCITVDEILSIRIEQSTNHHYYGFIQAKNTPILMVFVKDDIWYIKGMNYFCLEERKLVFNSIYQFKFYHKKSLLFCNYYQINTDQYIFYDIKNLDRIEIGRTIGNIRFNNTYVSNPHCRILCKHGRYSIEDLNSMNGTYKNNRRVYVESLKLGDIINIMGLKIIIGLDFIAINTLTNLEINDELIPSIIPFNLKFERRNFQYGEAVKIEKNFIFKERKILDPLPKKYENKNISFLMLGPQITMTIFSVLNVIMSSFNRFQTNVSSYILIVSILSNSILWPFIIRKIEKQKLMKDEKKRQLIYYQYLTAEEESIKKELNNYRNWLYKFFLTDLCIDKLNTSIIWRKINEENGVLLCIGVGDKFLRIPFHREEKLLSLDEDEMQKKKENFIDKKWKIKDIPIFINSMNVDVIYIYGNQQQLYHYFLYLLLHTLYRYRPSDIQIMILCRFDDSIHIPRFISHLFDEDSTRYIAYNKQMCDILLQHIKQKNHPTLIYCFEKEFQSYLQRQKLPVGSMIIYFQLESSMMKTPSITLQKHQAVYENKDERILLQWELTKKQKLCFSYFENLLSYKNNTYSFPKNVSLCDLWEVDEIHGSFILKQWSNHQSERTLIIPLGINQYHEILYLDMHENAHGPHGIIAGMTGSGKSEFLISMIMSLAIAYSPEDIAFLYIDYKGGGMSVSLKDLPHTAGIITNLDGNTIHRAFISLEAELIKRQKVFQEVAIKFSISSMNIDLYQRLYHEKKISECIPHLFIIADEFAELKQQEPEFMDQLIRVARIGRSLGVHLILSTQKPAGVVDDQILSNTRFRICLKVADKADSNDILNCEDGAYIRDIGRFYIQIGYNEIYEQAQSAYSKLIPHSINNGDVCVKKIDMIGNVVDCWKKDDRENLFIENEMQQIIRFMHQVAQVHSYTSYKIWKDELQKNIDFKKLKRGYLMCVDDPFHQKQFFVHVQKLYNNNLLISSNMQESEQFIITFLQASYYIQEKIDFVMIDFEQGNLSKCNCYENVKTVLLDDNHNEFLSFQYWLNKEIENRKKNLQDIELFIILHNYSNVVEKYEDFEKIVQFILKSRGSLKIYLIASISNSQEMKSRYINSFENTFIFQLYDSQELLNFVPSHWKNPKEFMRALWKCDEIFEVQIAHYKELNKLKTTNYICEKLLPLSNKIYISEMLPFCKKDKIAIGKDLITKEVIHLNFNHPIIITGNKKDQAVQALDKLLESKKVNRRYVETIYDYEVLLEKKPPYFIICSFTTNHLQTNYYNSIFQQEGKKPVIVFMGSDFANIQYLLNLEFPDVELLEMDAYIVSQEVVTVRWISI